MRLCPRGGGLSVLIESTTSSGESHGLYDYEKKTKFNQMLTVNDENDSYILFINYETGQLLIQPNYEEFTFDKDNFDHNLIQDRKILISGINMHNIQDIGKEFTPIIRLYLLKSVWYVEVIKDVNRHLRIPSNFDVSPYLLLSSNRIETDLYAFSRTRSFKGKSQYKEDNRIWIVAPKNSPGISLNKGDLLKFGRCKMLIHDIITTSSAAKDACSKVPYLPLMRQEDLSTSMESFLRAIPSVEVEEHGSSGVIYHHNVENTESFVQDVSSKYNLLDRVLDDCSKSKFIYKNVNEVSVEEDKFQGLFDSDSNFGINVRENLDNLKKLYNFFDNPTNEAASKTQVITSERITSDDSLFRDTDEQILNEDYISDNEKYKVYHKCCRICLSDDGDGFCDADEPLNPLICPCDCRGSLQYVHLQCLRTWLESRLEIPSGWFLHTSNRNLTNFGNEQIVQLSNGSNSTPYSQIRDRIKGRFVNVLKRWASRFSGSVNNVNSPACLHLKKFDCELCKVSFPTQLRIKAFGDSTTILPLFRIPRPKFPYMVLIPIEGECASKMGQIVVSFGGTNTPVCVGRGHNSDIRLGEISVSRAHAQFQHCHNNNTYQVCLLDMKSKFGSLVEFIRPMRLGKEGLSIQVGKTLISFKTFKSSRPISNIIPCLMSCIGRNGSVKNVNKTRGGDSKVNINLTVDSSNSVNFENGEFIPLADNTVSQSQVTSEGLNLDQDTKNVHSLRNARFQVSPLRHRYIFDP